MRSEHVGRQADSSQHMRTSLDAVGRAQRAARGKKQAQTPTLSIGLMCPSKLQALDTVQQALSGDA
jgi:hypothetical protein